MKPFVLILFILLLFFPNWIKTEHLSNNVYSIDEIDQIYSINPDLALEYLDSLRHQCEINGYVDITRQRLDITQSCTHFSRNEIRPGIYYATEALKYARKAGDTSIELLSLQMLCNGYNMQKSDEERYSEQAITKLRKTIRYYQVYCIISLIFFFLLFGFLAYHFRCQKKNPQIMIPEHMPSQVTEENKEEFESIYTSIIQFVVTEKHYLDKGIDISEVGKQCHINKELVNKVLNAKTNMTLLDLVNNCRLKYACTLLLDNSNRTVDVVADESGFKTTRTFLRQFKSRYNMLPSEYRRKM